nr:MAG TPA: hypothetical protein [Caudoviricetes sp.]DAS71900.1 MAG TPA: hypothetical protein [Caudoviricetes sp.]
MLRCTFINTGYIFSCIYASQTCQRTNQLYLRRIFSTSTQAFIPRPTGFPYSQR